MTLSDGISLLAVIVSVISAFIAWLYAGRAQRSSERANETQKEILEVQRNTATQAQQAQLKTRWSHRIEPTGYQGRGGSVLIVRCEGPAEARHVRILLDGQEASEHGAVGDSSEPPTPMKPGAEARYKFVYVAGGPRINTMRIEWVDPEGNGDDFETPV